MAKIIKAMSIALFICLSVSGCVPHTELNEKAIVEALGIDFEDEAYKVTIQYCNLTSSGGQSKIDTTQPNVLTAKGNGENVYSAMKDAELKIGRELMMGINQIIILGSAAAEKSVSDILSFATTYYQVHPNMLICTAEKTAEEILSVKFTEGTLSTERLSFLFANAEKSGKTPTIRVLDLFIDMKSSSRSFCLPTISVIEGDSDATEDGKTVELIGGIAFTDAKATGALSDEEMSGLALLGGKTERFSVEAQADGKTVSIGLYDIIPEIVPVISDEGVGFRVKFSANAEFLDTVSGEDSSEVTDELEASAEEKVGLLLENALESSVKRLRADVLRLETLLRHHDFDAWKKLKENWTDVVSTADFSCDTDIAINRYGLEE